MRDAGGAAYFDAVRIIFDLLRRIQEEASVPLLVIGGWALQAYGYTRQTVDVDCLISVEDLTKMEGALANVGFECFDKIAVFQRYRHQVNPLLVLDLMKVDSCTFTKLQETAQALDTADTTLRVPSFENLIALKLHAARNEHRTAKDVGDIAQLLRLNPGKISPENLRQLCDRFGTAAITRQLFPL